jgi:catechol 2,3-dioxygenase-like lactoylglutathione lyase family enzyme
MNLNQVTVPTTDFNASVEFYRTLGLIQIVHSPPRYARFEFPIGGATFSVHFVESVPQNSGVVIYFECDDLDAKVEELREKGIEFEAEATVQSWLWREAYLKDPGGNRICLYYAGENRRNPPWRIKT